MDDSEQSSLSAPAGPFFSAEAVARILHELPVSAEEAARNFERNTTPDRDRVQKQLGTKFSDDDLGQLSLRSRLHLYGQELCEGTFAALPGSESKREASRLLRQLAKKCDGLRRAWKTKKKSEKERQLRSTLRGVLASRSARTPFARALSAMAEHNQEPGDVLRWLWGTGDLAALAAAALDADDDIFLEYGQEPRLRDDSAADIDAASANVDEALLIDCELSRQILPRISRGNQPLAAAQHACEGLAEVYAAATNSPPSANTWAGTPAGECLLFAIGFFREVESADSRVRAPKPDTIKAWLNDWLARSESREEGGRRQNSDLAP